MNLGDVLNPKNFGKILDPHVTRFVAEPRPDYAAMQRLILAEQPGAPNVRAIDNERTIPEKR